MHDPEVIPLAQALWGTGDFASMAAVFDQAAEQIGCTTDAFRLRYQKLMRVAKQRTPLHPRQQGAAPPTAAPSPAPAAHAAVTVLAGPVPRPPIDTLWQRACEATDDDVERHVTEATLELRIEDTRPIGLSFISDQHIRQSGPIRVRAAGEDASLVRGTPGLYAMLGGDGVDNHIKFRAAMVGGGSKVADEWRLYDHYLSLFGPDKILALISGNHDDWTRDEAGVDMVSTLAQKNRVHYAPDEVRLTLHVEQASYAIALRHQYRYNSSFNQTHAIKRWWEMGSGPFDIGVVCHHHDAALEPFQKHDQVVWGARPGSYQVGSSHSRRYGFNRSKPTCPTFILFPDTKDVVGYIDLWQAADYLTYLRSAWPHGYRRRPAA